MNTYRITLADGGSFPCREDEYLFAAMLRARCGPVYYGCAGGGCGVCQMQVLDGPYQVAKRMSRAHVTEAEQCDGRALLCCIQPRGDMRIARVPNKRDGCHTAIWQNRGLTPAKKGG